MKKKISTFCYFNFLQQKKQKTFYRCESHNEKLTVYCSSCSKCICHQCALFNGYVSHIYINQINYLINSLAFWTCISTT